MGSSPKHRQQWDGLKRAEVVDMLRELADRVEQDTLVFDGQPTPLVQLKRVKVALRPLGDHFTVVQKLQVHRHAVVAGAPTGHIPESPPVAGERPSGNGLPSAGDLGWKALKRTMKQLSRELHVTFRQGRLPEVETVQWLRDASARQRALKGVEDPDFTAFQDICEKLLEAVKQADVPGATATWRTLCGQHRVCHRNRK